MSHPPEVLGQVKALGLFPDLPMRGRSGGSRSLRHHVWPQWLLSSPTLSTSVEGVRLGRATEVALMSDSLGRLGASQAATSLPFWSLEPCSREKVETSKGQFSFERGGVSSRGFRILLALSVVGGLRSLEPSLWTFHFSSACVLGASPGQSPHPGFLGNPPRSPGLALKLLCK